MAPCPDGVRATFTAIQHRVVAVDPGQIHHALVAELGQCRGIGRVADRLVVVQLGAERPSCRLFVAHVLGPAAFRDSLQGFRQNAGLERDRLVDLPLEILCPLARRHQDDELADPLRQEALIA